MVKQLLTKKGMEIMTEVSGGITTITKNGFESLNRDMLQDTNLSLEAIGLLSNIISYPSNWKLYKTELYSRFPKNKRTAIDRIWEELIENGYIVQFRKREGKKYVYQYLVSAFKFSKNEIIKIIDKVSKKGYSFYHKSMLKADDLSNIDPIDFITVKDDKIRTSDGYKQDRNENDWPLNPQQVKTEVMSEEEVKPKDTNSQTSDADYKQSNLNSPNTASNRLTSKRFTTQRFINNSFKSINDDEKYIKDNSQKSLTDLFSNSPQLKETAKVLLEAGAEPEDIFKIIDYFASSKRKIDSMALEQQLSWMQKRATTGEGISSFSSYFIGGYEKRCVNTKIRAVYSFDGLKSLNGELEKLPHIPMHNWLNE